MQIKRILAKLEIVLFADVLNPFWRPSARRRARRYRVLESVLTRYLKRYLPAVKHISSARTVKNKNEKIFTMWLQGADNAPPLVRACWNTIRKYCANELIVLDEKTLSDYVDLPDFVLKKRTAGKIGHAHFADIARVELMHKYGGIWMDATLFMTAKIPSEILDANFFMFLTEAGSAWGYGGVQNFFIRTKRGDYLLNAWRAMIHAYWQDERGQRIDYLVHQLLFRVLIENDSRAKIEYEKMPHISLKPTHRLWARKNEQFSKKLFNELTDDTFIQKTTYRNTDSIIPGSFLDRMINNK